MRRPALRTSLAPVGVRIAVVTALLVLAVGTVLLAASYWLLMVRLPDSFVVETAGPVAPTTSTPTTTTPTGTPEAVVPADDRALLCAAGDPSAPGCLALDGETYVVDVDDAQVLPQDAAGRLVASAVKDTAAQYERQLRRGFVTQAGVLLLGLTVPAVAVGGFAARRALRPVEAALERERRLMANVSHELRTPLANQRTALEVGLEDPDASAAELRRVADVALDQNRRVRRLIEELLVLARAEQGDDTDSGEVTDLADAARHAAAALAALPGVAPDPGVALDLAPAPVRGQAVLVERLVGNLVENAVRYNEPGGFVRVVTRVVDGTPRVEVENSGPVVAPAAVEGLFEPFRRGVAGAGDRVRSGHGVGLGLPLVAAVARRHGARVDAAARPGGGLHVTVTFPARVHSTAQPDPRREQVAVIEVPPNDA